ncbi:MAG: GNAT family N-acetyltransferase [Candidatus Helarchaeota archaeon]
MADVDDVRRLTQQLVTYRGKVFNETRFLFGFKKRIDPDSHIHHLFVCTLNGKVVGMTLAELIPTAETEAYLNTLFVDNAYHRQGVGKKLFDFVIEYLKNLGIKTVIINIRKNEPMEVKFFEKYGFETDFELKPFTCMIKKLN